MTEAIKTFKGLSTRPRDAFKNMSLIIEAASLLSATNDDKYREISDTLLAFVCNYANEAHQNESERRQ